MLSLRERSDEDGRSEREERKREEGRERDNHDRREEREGEIHRGEKKEKGKRRERREKCFALFSHTPRVLVEIYNGDDSLRVESLLHRTALSPHASHRRSLPSLLFVRLAALFLSFWFFSGSLSFSFSLSFPLSPPFMTLGNWRNSSPISSLPLSVIRAKRWSSLSPIFPLLSSFLPLCTLSPLLRAPLVRVRRPYKL